MSRIGAHLYALLVPAMFALIVDAAVARGVASTESTIIESTIEVPGPLGPLQGTLLAAGPDAPVVLVVPGSGPTDRNGNNPLGVSSATYRLLAEELGRRGISSVRIDKRGMFGSVHAVSDANNITIADYAADVRTWVAGIRVRTGTPCVWVLGHSEGGLVALAGAQEPGICGLVLVSSPGRPLGEVLREQIRANPANAPILDEALDAIAALEAGKSVDATELNPALLPLFHPSVQGFVRDAMAYDPAVLMGRYSGPVLILQGRRDLQTNLTDAERLKAANGHAELMLLDDVNHVLKAVTSDDRAVNFATYGDATLPLAPGVAKAITEFIGRHTKTR
ncbi:MAG TPA: alpha/beta fold hydrolase [Hyphomicrobium sp.]|nr:alpha/beta fold hydrolase [Hyphomicrobium sp.]